MTLPISVPSSDAPETEGITTPTPTSGGTTVLPVSQPAPEPKTQQDSGNWQERFAGLQRAYNELNTKYAATSNQLNSANTRVAELQGTLEETGRTTSNLTTDLQSEKERVAALDTKTRRQQLIFEKFPHLAGFEGEGLLPQAELDQLEATLTRFQAALGNEQIMKNVLYQQGGVPTPPATPKAADQGGDSAEVILRKAVEANVKGDNATYDALMKEYYRKVSVPFPAV